MSEQDWGLAGSDSAATSEAADEATLGARPAPDASAAQDRQLLIDFALWISNVWEKGNSDDEESARRAVDAFLRGDERD